MLGESDFGSGSPLETKIRGAVNCSTIRRRVPNELAVCVKRFLAWIAIIFRRSSAALDFSRAFLLFLRIWS
jgi:hypothetical protein